MFTPCTLVGLPLKRKTQYSMDSPQAYMYAYQGHFVSIDGSLHTFTWL